MPFPTLSLKYPDSLAVKQRITMLMDSYPSQQHDSVQVCHRTVFGPKQEVIRPKARFKPELAEKSEVDGGAIF